MFFASWSNMNQSDIDSFETVLDIIRLEQRRHLVRVIGALIDGRIIVDRRYKIPITVTTTTSPYQNQRRM